MIYKDSDTATGKAKPYGVIGLLLYRKIADTPQDDFDAANPQLVGLYTKSPMAVDIPNGVRGKLATYWAQWITRGAKASHGAGQVGPLAAPQVFVCPCLNPVGLTLFAVLGLFKLLIGGANFIGQRRKSSSIRSRRSTQNALRSAGIPPLLSEAAFTTPNIVLTFNQPVILNGIPQYLTDTGKLPTSASQTSDNEVTLVYTTPGSVTEITIPQQDPAIHSRTGGFVPAGTFPTT